MTVDARVTWLLDHFRESGSFTPDEVAAAFTDQYLSIAPAESTTGWLNGLRDKLAPACLERVVRHSPDRATIQLTDGNGLRWRFNCGTEEAAPGRIQLLKVKSDAPSLHGVTVREATVDDAAALADLERAAPWHLGDVTLVTDRGTDYFAPMCLLDDPLVVVAERGRSLVGVLTAVRQQVLIGGERHEALCVEHARIHPAHQGLGIVGQLMERLFDIFWALGTQVAYSFIHPENDRMKAVAVRALANRWKVRPEAMTMEGDHAPRPPDARPATPADLDWIADVLDEHHADELLWSPCSPDALRARLTRAPEAYSFSDLWISGGAVLGTWPAHRYRSVTRIDHRARTVRRDAVVVDYGFAPGAEDDFVRLLVWQASVRRSQGATGLLVLTSQGTRAHSVIGDHAASTHPFEMYLQPLPEPADAADSGVHVDPLAIPAQTFGAG